MRDIFDEMMLEIQNNFMTKTDGESEPAKVEVGAPSVLYFRFLNGVPRVGVK